jgi:hypothetical protein
MLFLDIAITSSSARTTMISVVTITSVPSRTSTSHQASTPSPSAFTLSPSKGLYTGVIIGIVVDVIIFIATAIFLYLYKSRRQIYPSRNTQTVAVDLVLQSHLNRLTPELSDKSRETELPDEQNIQPLMSQLKGHYESKFSGTDRPMLPNLEIAKYFMISSAVFSKLDKCLREFNPAYTSIIKNIGPRGMMRARADRQAQNARERLATNLQDKQDGSQESTAPQVCVLNTTTTVPRDITLVRAEKERRRKLDNNEIPPSTESLWRESQQDSPLKYRLLNRKTHFANQQGENYIDVSPAVCQQQSNPILENMWVHHRVFVRFKNLARKLIRSKPLPHQERLEWKCVSSS